MKRFFVLTVILLPLFGLAQDWRAGLSVSQGVNFAFIRAGDQSSMIGHSMGIEFFVRHHKSLAGIFFEPGIRFGKNTLRARATEALHVNMQQHALGLSVKGGLLISKAAYVKVGVLAEMVGYAMVETVDATGMRLGRSEFDEHLHPRHFMGGMIIGAGGAPGRSRGVELFIECHQYLTSPFLEPFTLDALGASQPPVFNSKALSTLLLAGVTFKFVKGAKRSGE